METKAQWHIAPDGTRIAYRVVGNGPALVLTNGLTTSTLFWKHVLPAWAANHTVLTWDLPGHGDSGPAATPHGATVEAQARCVSQLMAAAGIERAVQVGWSTGCQVVLETYRQYPDACEALALILGPAGHVLETTRLPVPGSLIYAAASFTPKLLFTGFFRVFSQVTRAPFGAAVGRKLGLVGAATADQDVAGVLAHVPTVHPGTLQTLLCSLAEHDASAVLASATLPLLIVAGEQDPFAPADLVGDMLHGIAPESELLHLPLGTHTALLDHAREIGDAVERLAARAQAASDK
jgi:pimeloyl-ACP methyl ester carboxylesterase